MFENIKLKKINDEKADKEESLRDKEL